jgi:hypothetical protein
MGEIWKNKPCVPTWNGLVPRFGPKVLMDTLDFASDSSIDISTAEEQKSGAIEFIQSLWIDNSANSATVTVRIQHTGQVIKVAPKTQGYFPCMAGGEFRATVSTTPAAGLLVTVGLCNQNMEPALWVLP